MRHHSRRIPSLVALVSCLVLLTACGGSSQQIQKAVHATPTPGQGQQVLSQTAQLLNSAQTLHGIFNATISGQFLNGEVDSEIWRIPPDKNRTQVVTSTIRQFATGSVTVSDGKQLWQYDPGKKIVYTGPASASSTSTDTPGSGNNTDVNQQQLILNTVQTIFTRSSATLISSTDTVNGHLVYTLHIVPQSQSSSAATGGFNYDGTVAIDQQSKLPLSMDLTVQGFGKVQLGIPTLDLNKPITNGTFTFAPPPGTRVLPLSALDQGQDSGSLTLQQAEQQAGYALLSIPPARTAYHLQSIDALGAPGNQIYTLTYTSGGESFTISESKALANLPVSGQAINLRGTTGTLSSAGGNTTLSWTEKGVGIQITGKLKQDQIVAIATSLV